MAVKVINRLYNEIYTDGDTDWLLGNVGEWQTLKLQAEVIIDFLATQESPVQIDTFNNAFVLTNGKTWGDYGFDLGMQVQFIYNILEDTNGDGTFNQTSVVQQTFNIEALFNDTMEVDQLINAQGYDSLPTSFGTKKVTNVYFYVDDEAEGCRLNYMHLSNNDFQSRNLNSFIDGSLPEFVYPNIKAVATNTWVTMEPVGLQSGMSIRQVRVRKLPGTTSFGIGRTYEFEIKYLISSFFEDINNLLEFEPPSYLQGDGSLTDNFLLKFYPEWNNPNLLIENDLERTERLGNTGWFNENFNQLDNDFKVESVVYKDEDDNVVEAVDYTVPTKVEVLVSGVPNIAQGEFGFGFAWLPLDDDDYKEKETAHYQNIYAQTGDINDGFSAGSLNAGPYIGAGINGASMDASNVRFTEVGGNLLCEFTLTPNAQFLSAFDSRSEDDRNYFIYVSVADGTLGRNFSDRVSLLADVSSMVKNIPPAGEYDDISNSFLEHPLDETNVGVSEYEGFIQDDVLCRMPFFIPTDGSIVFSNIAFIIEAFNPITGQVFELENYSVDLSQFGTLNGVQLINFDQVRGFKLESGNNKNWVRILRNPSADISGKAAYVAYYAFKIRWEDWISNNNAPIQFFDANLENDGLSNDWLSYLRTTGFVINFATKIIATVNNELLEYKNQFPLTFSDYDENDDINTTHRYYRDSDNTLLNVGNTPEGQPLGVVVSNDLTRVEIDFEITTSDTWDLASTYGVITIEIDRGAGYLEQRQLSSVWGSESDNPLKPLENETKLKLALDTTSKILTLSCLIDPNVLEDAPLYRVTGRVGCYDNGDGNTLPDGIYESAYESAYE